MKHNRIQEIANAIEMHQSISNEELCKMFQISIQTLRRDLNILEERGLITKVYGGVVSKTKHLSVSIPEIIEREQSHEKEKIKIGELAAALVENGDVIFIDSGTTAYHMIPFLQSYRDLTIISHSIHVFNALLKMKQIKCISLGGQLNHESYSFQTEIASYPYRYTKAFIATVGIDETGCSNTDLCEANIKKHVIANAEKSYLVADHSKFGMIGFNRFAPLEAFDGIVTDKTISPELEIRLKQKKIKIFYGNTIQ